MKHSYRTILLYSIVSAVLYSLGIFSFFCFIPFFMAYYIHGQNAYKRVAVVFVLLLVVWRLIGLFFFNNAVSPDAVSEETAIFDSASSIQFFIYEFMYILASITGIYILLKTSLRWIPRVVVASFFPFLVFYGIIFYMKSNTPEILSSNMLLSQLLTQFQVVDPTLSEAQMLESISDVFAFVILFSWVIMLVLLLLNWIISIFIVRRILHFNLHSYLVYVYGRIQSYNVSKLFFLGLISGGVLLLFRTSVGLMGFMRDMFGNVFFLILLVYFLYGVSMGYFLLAKRLKRNMQNIPVNYNSSGALVNLRSDLYSFVIFIIMMIPIFNTVLSLVFIILGVGKNLKYIKETYSSNKEYKNGSNTSD